MIRACTFLGAVCLFVAPLFAEELEFKIQPVPAVGPVPGKPAQPNDPKTKPKEEEVVEPVRTPAPPVDPRFLRLHLQDGSLLAGQLSVKEIEVTTSFGKLTVPIEKIKSFTPGLETNQQQLEDISKKIKELGSDDYKTREAAQKELARKGPRIRGELDRFAADDNAEVKRRIGEILKEFDEEQEAQEDDPDVTPAKPLIRLDTVTTTEFTVVGNRKQVRQTVGQPVRRADG
jgi:hypothetical protein